MNKAILAAITLILLSITAFGDIPPDAAMLTGEAVQTALSKFFSTPEHENYQIYRSIFTPGSRHRVGDKFIPVTYREEIEAGKDTQLVRIAEVAIRETDSAPPQLTITVHLVTWTEKGQSGLVPMHAFPTYEITLGADGILEVTKETLSVE